MALGGSVEPSSLAHPETAFGPDVLAVRNALLSLSDRAGAVGLARALVAAGATLWATEGTAGELARAGLAVRAVGELVGQGAWLGGRVKTLHPGLLGGVLARRDVPTDLADLATRGVPPIDLVAVALYPFESLPGNVSREEALETIDVGGVTLLRAAAKNLRDVAVLSSPGQYEDATRSLAERGGIPFALRRAWARAAFERTASYDAAIASWFAERGEEAGVSSGEPPETWLLAFRRARRLRYGENPHQDAALYLAPRDHGIAGGEALLEGRELSYNNLLDLDAAVGLVHEFAGPACAVVKHNEPAGVGLGENALEAFERAFAADSLSAFGGVVALNRDLDEDTARALARPFLEVVAAPEFTAGALSALSAKKNLRLVRLGATRRPAARWQARPLGRALLVQAVRADAPGLGVSVVTRRHPTPDEMEALLFAWTVAAHARSNAIVFARVDRTLGIGSGQTSRIDAVEVALLKARRCGHDLAGAVLASDGFFPFADWVEAVREAGLAAVIQPGGSVRDRESIEACDAAGLAMVFTGRRQFRH